MDLKKEPFADATANATPADKATPLGRFFARLRTHAPVRPEDAWGAGVCAALAAKAGCRAFVIRIAFLVLGLGGFPIGILYGALWLLLPNRSGRVEAEEIVLGRDFSMAGVVVLGLIVGQAFNALT